MIAKDKGVRQSELWNVSVRVFGAQFNNLGFRMLGWDNMQKLTSAINTIKSISRCEGNNFAKLMMKMKNGGLDSADELKRFKWVCK